MKLPSALLSSSLAYIAASENPCSSVVALDFFNGLNEIFNGQGDKCTARILKTEELSKTSTFCDEVYNNACTVFYYDLQNYTIPDCTHKGEALYEKYLEGTATLMKQYEEMTDILYCDAIAPEGICEKDAFFTFNDTQADALEQWWPCKHFLESTPLETDGEAVKDAFCADTKACMELITAVNNFDAYPNCSFLGTTMKNNAMKKLNETMTEFDTSIASTCGSSSCGSQVILDFNSNFALKWKYQPCAELIAANDDEAYCGDDTDACKVFFTHLNTFEYPNCTMNGVFVEEKYKSMYACSSVQKKGPTLFAAILTGLLSLVYLAM